jgi:peptidoglycan hydrolase-like protein with peptidoglycan-binding domain
MHLVKGSTESDVAHLQALLAKEGLFTGQTNGYYGLETESAVKKFQARYGLEQLGEVGPGTRAALNKLSQGVALAAVVTAQYRFVSFLSVGSKGAEVKALQQRLTNLGIYSGPISGTFGPATERAVKAFQKQFGVKQAGYVGPSTRDLLNR